MFSVVYTLVKELERSNCKCLVDSFLDTQLPRLTPKLQALCEGLQKARAAAEMPVRLVRMASSDLRAEETFRDNGEPTKKHRPG